MSVIFQENHYSLELPEWGNGKIVEILKNNGRVVPNDEHFNFGLAKAGLALAAMSVIKDFVNRKIDLSKFHSKSVTFTESETGDPFFIKITPNFKHSRGFIVENYYLTIASSEASRFPFEFGFEKAKAIVALENEIFDWRSSISGGIRPLENPYALKVRIAPNRRPSEASVTTVGL